MEDEIAELLVNDMFNELDNKEKSSYVVCIRSGSAEVELERWRAQPSYRRQLPSGVTLVSPLDFLDDLLQGRTSHLILDGATALSTNPSTMMPVIGALAQGQKGTITVLCIGQGVLST